MSTLLPTFLALAEEIRGRRGGPKHYLKGIARLWNRNVLLFAVIASMAAYVPDSLLASILLDDETLPGAPPLPSPYPRACSRWSAGWRRARPLARV